MRIKRNVCSGAVLEALRRGMCAAPGVTFFHEGPLGARLDVVRDPGAWMRVRMDHGGNVTVRRYHVAEALRVCTDEVFVGVVTGATDTFGEFASVVLGVASD